MSGEKLNLSTMTEVKTEDNNTKWPTRTPTHPV